jgi:MarR family transcriptional regulator, organic hydroperoxide resistance regulator
MKTRDELITEYMEAGRDSSRASLMVRHKIAGAVGLGAAEAECIDFLMEMGPSTAGELARATRLSSGSVTSLIDRLEIAGIVRRARDPNDGRKVIVRLLPNKIQRAVKLYAAMANDLRSLVAGYDRQELVFLLKHARAVTEIHQKHAALISATILAPKPARTGPGE